MKIPCIKILMLIIAMTLAVPSHAKKLVLLAPDKNNQKVIKRYNRYQHRYEVGPHAAIGYTALFGVKTNSVMSTDDVEVNVVKKWVQDVAVNDQDNRFYFVEIKNKCDDTIYIDKGYCFRIYNNGTRYRYFDPNEKHADTAKRFIAIPPHSKRNLSDYKAKLINKGKYKELIIDEYPEEFNWNVKAAGVYRGRLNLDEVVSFSENDSPYYRSFLISYSKEKDFSTYSYLTINFYIRQLIGRYVPEYIQKSLEDYNVFRGDKYTIINSEWARELNPF